MGFIKYIVIIIVILAVVFLSQQLYFRGIGKTLISSATNQVGAYLAKGTDWAMSTIYPKISGEVQNGGDTITTQVNQVKKLPENILTKVGNYFSGIANSVLHPGQTNNNCPAQPAQTSSGK